MGVFKQTARAAGEGGEAIPIPTAGTHPAVLAAVVDLGTHRDRYQDSGKEYEKRRVYLCWELHDEEAEGGPRFFVGADFTLSFGENAKLRKLVEAWRGSRFAEGEEFDVSALLGKACLAQVVHKTSAMGRTFAQLTGCSRLMKGMQPVKPTHQPFLYEVGDKAELPGWLPYLYGRPVAEHLAESKEMRSRAAPAAEGGEGEVTAPAGAGAGGDDIPW